MLRSLSIVLVGFGSGVAMGGVLIGVCSQDHELVAVAADKCVVGLTLLAFGVLAWWAHEKTRP